ncbi:MAG: uracil-DNA glycosylase, partial [Bacteroidetes bacterium QH_9_64_21]
MKTLLRELRSIIEHERTLRGDLLPLAQTDPASPSAEPEASPTMALDTDSASSSSIPEDTSDTTSDDSMPNRDLFGNQVN